MAIEIPNIMVAGGLFDPNANNQPPFVPTVTPITSASGIDQFDPSGTPALPKGGFTQLAPGAYCVKITDTIDAAEGMVFVESHNGESNVPAQPRPNATVYNDAMIVPVVTKFPALAQQFPAGTDDYRSILVATTLFGEGAEQFAFQLAVFRFATGPRFSDLFL